MLEPKFQDKEQSLADLQVTLKDINNSSNTDYKVEDLTDDKKLKEVTTLISREYGVNPTNAEKTIRELTIGAGIAKAQQPKLTTTQKIEQVYLLFVEYYGYEIIFSLLFVYVILKFFKSRALDAYKTTQMLFKIVYMSTFHNLPKEKKSIICKNCHAPLDVNFKLCPYCGVSVTNEIKEKNNKLILSIIIGFVHLIPIIGFFLKWIISYRCSFTGNVISLLFNNYDSKIGYYLNSGTSTENSSCIEIVNYIQTKSLQNLIPIFNTLPIWSTLLLITFFAQKKLYILPLLAYSLTLFGFIWFWYLLTGANCFVYLSGIGFYMNIIPLFYFWKLFFSKK